MNKSQLTLVPTSAPESDDPLAGARGIVHGLLIVGGAGALVALWLAGPGWWLIIGVVGLVLMSPWGWHGRKRGAGR